MHITGALITVEMITIKKYSNRRLYNKETSKYITLEDIKNIVISGESIVVLDASTGDDITNIILLQVIIEQENKGIKLIPKEFLENVLRMNVGIQKADNWFTQVNPYYSFIKNLYNFSNDKEEK